MRAVMRQHGIDLRWWWTTITTDIYTAVGGDLLWDTIDIVRQGTVHSFRTELSNTEGEGHG